TTHPSGTERRPRSCTFSAVHIVLDVHERVTHRPGGQGVAGSNPAVPTGHQRPAGGRYTPHPQRNGKNGHGSTLRATSDMPWDCRQPSRLQTTPTMRPATIAHLLRAPGRDNSSQIAGRSPESGDDLSPSRR